MYESYRKLKGKVARKEHLSPLQLKRFNKLSRYREKAKKLRATHAFGDMFTGKGGVNLLYPDKWTPQVKARVTKYAKELGPLIAGPSVTKRYFRPDHLSQAIQVSPQERRLPGQKAAIFTVDDIQTDVEIIFDKKHRIKRLMRGGIEEVKIDFDMNALIRDPETEFDRVMSQAPGKFFKFITGANQSKETYNATELGDQFDRIIKYYDPGHVEKFLYGIIAYPGIRADTRLKKRDQIHAGMVTARQRKRLRELAKQKPAFSRAELRGIRTKGRRGRIK